MAGTDLLLHLEFQDLIKRKLSSETCRKFGYGVVDIEGITYQVAPYMDSRGNLAGQHLRGPNKSFRWRGLGKADQLQFFGQHLWNSGGKMVTVVEGELDCLSLSQAQGNKWPVVSIPSGVGSAEKAFKANIEWLEGFERVNICFDSDEPGREAAHKAAEILTPGKAHIVSLPLKDASDMLVAGRVDELIACIWQAPVFRPDGIVAGEDLWDTLITPPPHGYDLPYPKLNEMTGGARKRELWIITAGSGIGKSTLIHELGYHLMMVHDCRIGVIALEESKRRTAERYLSIYLNTPLHLSREGVSEKDLHEAFKNTIGSGNRFFAYDHFGSSDIDGLLGKIKYLATACSVDFILLDHISMVVSGLSEGESSERKMIDMLMTKLRALVEETGVGVIAISHLKRPPNTGKSWNDGKEPGLADLRGSGSLEQLSDMVITMKRNQSDEDDRDIAVLSVKKNRYLGLIGDADTLIYDQTTGRLQESSINEMTSTKKTSTDKNNAEEDF